MELNPGTYAESLTIQYSYILCWRLFLIFVSMILSVFDLSLQLGLSFVGVICSATLDVSNNGGNYGHSRYTMNTRCRKRNIGMFLSFRVFGGGEREEGSTK